MLQLVPKSFLFQATHISFPLSIALTLGILHFMQINCLFLPVKHTFVPLLEFAKVYYISD